MFADVRTQWRVGFAGPTGLDYPALMTMMDLHGVKKKDRRQMLDDIQVMELAALNQMAVTYT